jgi:hypothetical protein
MAKSDAVVKDQSSITDKTVFLIVRFKVIGNSRRVSNSVLETDADKSFLRVQKSLLESPELDAIKKADGQMRSYLYNQALPYDMGIYLLPIALIETVQDRLSAYQDERAELVTAFVDAYPNLCSQASQSLGSLHNPSDYPAASAVAAKFSFDWQYISFSVPESLKVSGIYNAEMEKQKAKIEEAASEITALMRETMLELINHLKTALEPNADGKPKRLFASAVTNIQDFLDTFKARNITNDSELDAMCDEIKKVIHPQVYADVLRKDESLKTQVHTALEGFTAKLTTMVETVPNRKFRKE